MYFKLQHGFLTRLNFVTGETRMDGYGICRLRYKVAMLLLLLLINQNNKLIKIINLRRVTSFWNYNLNAS